MRVKVLGALFGAGMPKTVCSGHEFVYDPQCADYDWLVVYDELPCERTELRCPRENTILCTWEPVSIKSYSRAYTRQFGHLLTNRPPEAERHPGYHLGRGYFVWFVHNLPKGVGHVEKSKAISAVCSAKQMKHTRHYARYRLVEELSRGIPELDWYGKGVRPLKRKEDALLPYRYHVAVENHIGPHHWTEKLSDAFLCECLPFYAGDPALTEVFPAESFIPIPIDDPADALRIIREAIDGDAYAKRREAVLEAKRLVLSKYNFWAQVAEVIESGSFCAASAGISAPSSFLYARKALRRRNLMAAAEDGWDHFRRFVGF